MAVTIALGILAAIATPQELVAWYAGMLERKLGRGTDAESLRRFGWRRFRAPSSSV